VIALAPYAQPLLNVGKLPDVKAPVLFQAGELDQAVPPQVIQDIFGRATGPRCSVVYQGAGHLAWVYPGVAPADLAQPQFNDAMSVAAIAFLKDALDGLPLTAASLTSAQARPPECK
jgi:fermentation-respiration switch protein FrsA (DUF1100 family)